MSISDSDQILYDEFDRLVADETDPAVIEALKHVWLVWDKDAVPWMRPRYGRCTHCGRPGRVLTYMHDLSSECSHCYYDRILGELREKEDKRKEKFTPKLDIEDFARL